MQFAPSLNIIKIIQKMAKIASFKFSDVSFNASLSKIDRKKLYGYTELKVTDPDEKKCSFANLTEDGMHILPTGSTGIMTLNSDGNYIARSEGKVVDENGKPVDLVPSIYDEEVNLQAVDDVSEYLDLNVKAVYQLTISEGEKGILKLLEEQKLLYLMYNYRADYEGDDAYLLSNEGTVFMVVGHQVDFNFIGLEEVIYESELLDEEQGEDFDFGML